MGLLESGKRLQRFPSFQWSLAGGRVSLPPFPAAADFLFGSFSFGGVGYGRN